MASSTLLNVINRELQPSPIPTAAAAAAQSQPQHDRLLQEHAEAGALRSTPAAAAARKLHLVTSEALHLVHAAQAELRQAQQAFAAEMPR
jgi:hypothetical protein